MPYRHLIPVSREPLSLLSVERAISELRRGRAVAVKGGDGQGALVLAAEAATAERLVELTARAGGAARIALTPRRASVLGLLPAAVRIVVVTPRLPLTLETVRAIADPLAALPLPAAETLVATEVEPHTLEAAALQLTKTARLLPAAVMADIAGADALDLGAWAVRHDLLAVDAGDVFQHLATSARALKRVAEARVPLAGAEDALIAAFRPLDGGFEHYVIKLGEPDPELPVLTRVHSACFTGDLLGSLRCDCGDQLRGAITAITEAGGGLILYLAQEGRGIGLVNKLRAYALQDTGYDTLEANEQLGFEADERVYLPAAQMLRAMGVTRVRLMTNNPDKVAALGRLGITVTERVPHAFPANRHNAHYIRTKRARGGHLD
jgi:GTP cyclohydrolase II